MSREELMQKLHKTLWKNVPFGGVPGRLDFGRLTDFILENFVEKPKPTAVERLAVFLRRACPAHLSDHGSQCVASDVFSHIGLVKDIIAQYDDETYKATLRRDVYKG